jgi:biotin transport system substrate-specific component
MLPGSLVVFAIGVAWLAFWLHGNLLLAIETGLLPFIPGDLIKLVVAAILLPTAWAFVRSFRGEALVDKER